MSEWGIALIGVAGLVMGVIITESRHWLDRKQRYRIMTFEKRLEAHQTAFYWCQQLNQILNNGEPSKIHSTAVEAREWWKGNCLFLDNNSRTKMHGLFNLVHSYANEKQRPVQQAVNLGDAVWNRLDESFKAIMEGIGTEYLSDVRSKD